eukprot:6474952-Amphidinium_carterae.1
MFGLYDGSAEVGLESDAIARSPVIVGSFLALFAATCKWGVWRDAVLQSTCDMNFPNKPEQAENPHPRKMLKMGQNKG